VKQKFGTESSTGIAVRNGFLYVAEDAAVVRYPLRPGELEPSGPPETLVTLTRQRSHAAKGLAFDGRGGMYVNIGAPSNTCAEKEGVPGSPGKRPCDLLEKHGGIWRFDEGRPGQSVENGGRRYATGLRQFYALEWRDGSLYALQHGRDSLNTLFPKYFDQKQNAELPSEELLRIEEGSNFGWPYCYHDWRQQRRVLAPEYGGDGKMVGECAKYSTPLAGYPGHWAPGDLHFYAGKQFPEKYRNGAFIAFQGSWNRAPEPAGGYKVVFQPLNGVRPSGSYEVFADGFSGATPLMRREDAKARPAGIAEALDGSLYISDMVNGKIWRVIYRGGSK
jgi:glucose/arabinose dehydrogenase